MRNLEFYIYEDELWCISPDGSNEKITESQTELVKGILDRIRECYPSAYKSLMECYRKSAQNVPYFQYLMVNRFCKCNFGELDNTTIDIDNKGRFNFERVKCPLRGECKYEGCICNPVFNSRISDAEMRVMKMIYDGCNNEEIADKLYLSPHTVKNHIKSVYLKLYISCRTQYIPVETVRTEYKTRDSIRFDSIYQHDSVFYYKNGDTIYQYKYKFLYRYLTINKVDTVIKTDSVQVPYPVEKKLSRWQSMKLELGGWAFGVIIIMALIIVVWLVYRLKKK